MFLYILRAFASMLAGLAIFLAVALLLFHYNLRALLNDELYANALADQNAYERLYTEALTTENIELVWSEVSMGAGYLTSSELRRLMITVAPPEYLQAQTETNLSLLSAFAIGESDELELYLDISGPLDRVVAATVDLIVAKVEQTPLVDDQLLQHMAAQSEGNPYSQEIAGALESISTGRLESHSITDLTGLSEDEVLEIFDQAMVLALDSDLIDQQYRAALEQAEPQLRQAFETGDTRLLLAESVRTAAAPALDTALAEYRVNLDRDGRLDLVPLLAEEVADVGEEQFQANASEWRDGIAEILSRTRNLGLIVLVAASGLVVLIYWGRPRQIARWFYRLLILVGGGSLVSLTVAYFALPGVVDRAVNSAWMAGQVEVQGLVVLTLDIVISVISSRLVAHMWLAGGTLAIGVLLWAAFLTWDISHRKRQSGEQAPEHTDPSSENNEAVA